MDNLFQSSVISSLFVNFFRSTIFILKNDIVQLMFRISIILDHRSVKLKSGSGSNCAFKLFLNILDNNYSWLAEFKVDVCFESILWISFICSKYLDSKSKLGTLMSILWIPSLNLVSSPDSEFGNFKFLFVPGVVYVEPFSWFVLRIWKSGFKAILRLFS